MAASRAFADMLKAQACHRVLRVAGELVVLLITGWPEGDEEFELVKSPAKDGDWSAERTGVEGLGVLAPLALDDAKGEWIIMDPARDSREDWGLRIFDTREGVERGVEIPVIGSLRIVGRGILGECEPLAFAVSMSRTRMGNMDASGLLDDKNFIKFVNVSEGGMILPVASSMTSSGITEQVEPRLPRKRTVPPTDDELL